MNYRQFVSRMASVLNMSQTDGNFLNMLPAAIDYTENRMQHDFDLLSTVVRDTSVSTTAGVSTVACPTTFVVVESVSVVTPAGSAADAGTRNPLRPVSKEFLDFAWPTRATDPANPVPQYFAPIDGVNFLLAPTPAGAYVVEFSGTQDFVPLSASNASNFLSVNFPELYFAGAMVFMSGFQRDFGAQAGDPQQGQSWETQYTTLRDTIMPEEVRKKFQSAGWTAKSPTPLATPQRQ